MTTHFLTVPGLASSGPQHWQTIWENQYPHLFSRVQQENWDWPVKVDWVAQLQKQISELTVPTVLVAHSLGCITVAHWAQEHFSEYIKGALLVAPADAELSKRLNFVVGFHADTGADDAIQKHCGSQYQRHLRQHSPFQSICCQLGQRFCQYG
jgi:predicted alpha/beta hydrolase family esterase